MEQLGTYLKTQRELRQIGLSKIAEETKISVNWLKFIEEDQWDGLPGKTFARGYTKAYAIALGLDVDDVLSRYDHMHLEADKVDVGTDVVKIAKRRGPGIRKYLPFIVIILAVAVIAIVTWHIFPT